MGKCSKVVLKNVFFYISSAELSLYNQNISIWNMQSDSSGAQAPSTASELLCETHRQREIQSQKIKTTKKPNRMSQV